MVQNSKWLVGSPEGILDKNEGFEDNLRLFSGIFMFGYRSGSCGKTVVSGALQLY